MPKMTGPDLKSSREALLLSAQAMTDRLRDAGLVPVGNLRTIQRWEEGARPVPDDIAEYVLGLERQVAQMAAGFMAALSFREARARGGPAFVAMLRYEEDAHLPGAQAPHDHRLHAAALQRARSAQLGQGGGPGLHLIVFDPEAFGAWCRSLSKTDTAEARAQWAALQVAAVLCEEQAPAPAPTPAAESQATRRPHPRAHG